MSGTSFDNFAEEYDKANKNSGDFTHEKTADPALYECIGEIANLTIYDIACGNGYNARYFVKNGAKEVWASDVSPKLIEIASKRYDNAKIKYLVRDATDINDIPENYFDLVTISMAIHYLSDLDTFFANINKILKKDGRIVFVTNHPLANLGRLAIQSPGYDMEKALKRAKRYLEFHAETTKNMWVDQEDITIYRASLSLMINTLVKNGFLVDKMIEPKTITNYANNSLSKPKNAKTEIPILYALGATKVGTSNS